MHSSRRTPGRRARRITRLAFILLCLSSATAGCAAMTNPVADGLPARRVPPELLVASKATEQPLPLNLLRQPPAAEYLIGPGDVLGVYVQDYLGSATGQLPVHNASQVQPRTQRPLTPSSGYPIQVMPDGYIYLPVAGRLRVEGMTLHQANDAIRDLYARRDLLKADKAIIGVSLMQPRTYSVLVLRQEASGFATLADRLVAASKRGAGFEVDLPAYENDVLHALTRTGGLPGLDAYNEVVIYRDCFKNPADRLQMLQWLGGIRADCNPLRKMGVGGKVIRIPLHVALGQPIDLRPEDVLLQTGDVVYLEARDDQLFYTGGLLPPGAHVLPRDYDLDVLSAVAQVRGPLLNGAFGVSNLSGALIQPGIGNPSPAMLVVLRKTPGGGQVPIVVDLDRAMRHAEERILVQAGDVLLLQERPDQALTRYVTQTAFNFNVVWQVIRSRFANGFIDVSAPDRLQPRVDQLQVLPR
jgi:protein involved in polysaccharide export with SLBB domain